MHSVTITLVHTENLLLQERATDRKLKSIKVQNI